MAVTKRFFSAASGGRTIAIATGLTTIHTSVSVTNQFDEVQFYVHNTTSVSRQVTWYWGATLAKDTHRQTIPSRDGLYLCIPGSPLGLGKILKAQATGGGSNLVGEGWVNRII